MQRFPEDKGVVIMGLISLATLSWRNQQGIERIVQANAVPILNDFLVRSPTPGSLMRRRWGFLVILGGLVGDVRYPRCPQAHLTDCFPVPVYPLRSSSKTRPRVFSTA